MSSDDYWGNEDPDFLEALAASVLTPPDLSKKRKRIRTPSQPTHSSPQEDGFAEHVVNLKTLAPKSEPDYEDESYIYGASAFGGFGDYMRRKRAKLQIQNRGLADGNAEPSQASQIFKGVAVYVNGFTEPPFQDLREMIMAHGGVFHAYLDRKSIVTHIVATQLTPAKILEYQRGKMKIVTPQWIVESVAAGSLLRWQDYALKASGRGPPTEGLPSTSIPDRAVGTSETPQKTLDLFSTQKKRTSAARPAGRPKQGVDSGTLPFSAWRSETADQEIEPPAKQKLSPNSKHDFISQSNIPSPTRVVKDPNSPETSPRKEHPSYAKFDSNPHAAKLMESSVWRQNNTSASADYAENYFQKSRLHHLSAWKAELREVVREARERAEKASEFGQSENGPGETGGIQMDGVSLIGLQHEVPSLVRKGADAKTTPAIDRVIMHCDFDSFFVSAGLVDKPHLKGKPVVVCHGAGAAGAASTSEIASASYEARKFNIKNGMSLGQAKQLCPIVQPIPYEFEKYKTLSRHFYTILMNFADDLQAVSVDEALLDVSNRVHLAQSQLGGEGEDKDVAIELAEVIRDKMREATKCEVSIGISHNVMLARIATRHAKPAGSYHLLPEAVPTHLASLAITSVHGVGRSIRDKIQEKFGASTLGELKDTSKDALRKLLGDKTGDKIWKAVRGVDDTVLESDKPRKSVSAEVNYGIRFESAEQAEAFILSLSGEVSKRLKTINKMGRALTLKIMKRHPDAPKEAAKFLGHGHVECFNKSTNISGPGGQATDDAYVVGRECMKLLNSFNFDPTELRGIGIQIQKLEDVKGGSLKDEAVTDAGQSTLQFVKVDDTTEIPPPQKSLKAKGREKVADVEIIDVDADDPLEHPMPSSDRLALPPASQLDAEVLESLPEDIRNEIMAGYDGAARPTFASSSKRAGAFRPGGTEPSKAIGVSETDPSAPSTERQSVILPETEDDDVIRVEQRSQSVPPPQESPTARSKAMLGDTFGTGRKIPKAFSVSPSKPKASDVRHITKQLASKRKVPVTSNTKISLFDIRQPTKIDVSAAELIELGIDVNFFKELPTDIQREQLAEQRMKAKILARGSSLTIPDHVFGAGRSSRAPSAGRSRSPSVVPAGALAKFGRQPVPRAWYTTLPRIKKLSEVAEVQKMIDDWIQYRIADGPIPMEVQRVVNFLVACAESDVGLERLVGIMKWWKLSLRNLWSDDELLLKDGVENEGVGLLWWSAFWQAKNSVDDVVRKRFGCGISI